MTNIILQFFIKKIKKLNHITVNFFILSLKSQNSARPNSGKGLAYITQKQTSRTILLFVREQAKDENGRTMRFVNFGQVDFVKYEGIQPMNITWKLAQAMPAYLWHDTAKLAVG
jgi:homospermidine synthase